MTHTATPQPTFSRLMGSPGSPSRRLGTVTLTREQTFRREAETAAWYQNVIVPAGATAELRCNGYYVFATLHGVKGSSDFTPRFGAYSGPAKLDEGLGEPDTYSLQIYAYSAAEAIVSGTFLDGATVRLDEDIVVLLRQIDDVLRGGRKFHWAFAATTDAQT